MSRYDPPRSWYHFFKFGTRRGASGRSPKPLRLVSSNDRTNEDACELSSRARFPISVELVDRQKAARYGLGENSIKRLIEEQPEIMDPPRWPPDAA